MKRKISKQNAVVFIRKSSERWEVRGEGEVIKTPVPQDTVILYNMYVTRNWLIYRFNQMQ